MAASLQHRPSGRTLSRELSQKLLGRQARSETDGAVFETTPSITSNADMVWNQVTASQFTPRPQEDLDVTGGGEASSSYSSNGVACAGGAGGQQRSASPPGKPSSHSSSGHAGKPPAGNVVAELSTTVNELRENVERERERSRQLEKRATEAEFIAVWLKEELDKSAPHVDLDGTQPVIRAGRPEDEDMDSTQPVLRRVAGAGAAPEDDPVTTRPQLGLGSSVTTQPKMGLALPHNPGAGRLGKNELQVVRMPSYDPDIDISTMDDTLQLREELHRSHEYIEQKQQEIISLEEQNLVLREELNQEKQKVIELKRAANSQKEVNQKASEDLEMNRWLQEEVSLLRNEATKLQQKLEQAASREEFLKTELADLRVVAGSVKDNPIEESVAVEEMGRLSIAVGEQLVSVERELAQRTRELSEATEPFLKHAHGLLSVARKACVQIDSATGRLRSAPVLYELGSRDLSNSFRSILKLLKYMVEVLAQHTGMVFPYERGGDAFSVTDTAASLASSLQDFNSSQLNRGLRAPSEVGSFAGGCRNEKAADPPQAEPQVREPESTKQRWMCYLQD